MRITGHTIDVSEQHLYWNAKERDGFRAQPGTFIETAMNALVQDGTCLEQTWPYVPALTIGDEGHGPRPPSVHSSPHVRVGRATALVAPNAQAIRASLDAGVPVAFSMQVFKSWTANPYASQRGLIPMPVPGDLAQGGHAVCATGYVYDGVLSGGGGIVFRNSWGTSWAEYSLIEPGYGVLPFAYVDDYAWEAYTCG